MGTLCVQFFFMDTISTPNFSNSLNGFQFTNHLLSRISLRLGLTDGGFGHKIGDVRYPS